MLYQLSYVGRIHVERVMGIEPTSSAWKAEVLPLNYTRIPSRRVYAGNVGRQSSRATDVFFELVEGVGFEPTKA